MPLDWQQLLDQAIDARAAEMISVRRYLHSHPEPSGEEYQSSLYIQRILCDFGLRAQLGPAKRGVIADLPQISPAPCIALRADMDALRIQDAKSVEYRSQCPGVMHACGHDSHTATVLGALLGLQALQEAGVLPWPVNWRGIFQPAEETATGACEMIAGGAIDGVAAILSLHMDPSRAVGSIGLRYGALMAACDTLEFTINGRGGHAARPHESLDPIAAAAQLINSLYTFIPRVTNSFDSVVLTIGQIRAGDSPNVIPAQAVLRGTLRTLESDTREKAKSHIYQIARGVAEMSGTSIEVDYISGTPSLHNDAEMTDLLKQAGTDILGAHGVEIMERPLMGGEDFAFYLQHIPGAMFRLGCASPSKEYSPLHSPHFDIDERALAIGAKILARAVVLWCNPQRA